MNINDLINDFRNKQAELIQNSGLPPIILELLLKDYYNQVHVIVLSQSNNAPEKQEESNGEHSGIPTGD